MGLTELQREIAENPFHAQKLSISRPFDLQDNEKSE